MLIKAEHLSNYILKYWWVFKISGFEISRADIQLSNLEMYIIFFF